MIKRRSILTMLGLAPVVASVPAVAETRRTQGRIKGLQAKHLHPESYIDFEDGKLIVSLESSYAK